MHCKLQLTYGSCWHPNDLTDSQLQYTSKMDDHLEETPLLISHIILCSTSKICTGGRCRYNDRRRYCVLSAVLKQYCTEPVLYRYVALEAWALAPFCPLLCGRICISPLVSWGGERRVNEASGPPLFSLSVSSPRAWPCSRS
jgi:hypothetical protein